MYRYPPSHMEWGWWLCSIIVPVAVILILATIGRRSRRTRLVTNPLIAIVVLWMFFIAVLAPSMGGARPTAQRTFCQRNLEAISVATREYHDEYGHLPPPQVVSKGGLATSWRIDLKPYIQPDHSSPSADYNTAFAWDHSANLPLAQWKTEIYWCPANRTPQDDQQRWYTAYAFLTGPGTAFPAEGPRTFDDIADGTTSTLLAVEACGRNIVWTEPRDVDVSREEIGINAAGNQPGTSNGIISSYHRHDSNDPGGANCAFADGHAGFLSQKISPDVLRKLTTATGGEVLSNDEF